MLETASVHNPAEQRFDSPFDYLTWDHDRLDGLLAAAHARVDRGEDPSEQFRAFCAGLERHMSFEEEVLFPAFDRQSGMINAGPTAVMRYEHETIVLRVSEMHDALATHDLERFRTTGARLDAVIAAHNIKEERVLYPAVNRVLGELERRAFASWLSGA